MAQLHKADVCLNHAMSVSVSHTNPDSMKRAGGREAHLHTLSNGVSKIYTKFITFLEPPHAETKPVESFFTQNIELHECSISSFVKDGKRYVWYYNPWGYLKDRDEKKSNTLTVPHKSCVEDAKASEIEGIRENVPACGDDYPMFESEKIKLLGYRIFLMLKNLEKRGGDDARKAVDILQTHKLWLHPNGDTTKKGISELHVMSTLQLLKLATDSEHLVVIHPFDSMLLHGPQHGEDTCLDDETLSEMKTCSDDYGACVLWTTVYMRRVKKVMTEMLGKRRTVPQLLETIKNTLTHDPLGGEKGAKFALAKYNDEYGGQKGWKTILSAVYDMIPQEGRNDDVKTRYRESSDLNSNWHVETVWKLDLVYNYVKEAIDRKHGTVDTIDTIDVYPECVAGFIEAIYIVASAEVRANPAYLEEVGKIATFVIKSRLHTLNGVYDFVRMLKLLIICKQDKHFEKFRRAMLGKHWTWEQIMSGELENMIVQDAQDYERKSYPLPTVTRSDRDDIPRLLQEHAGIFGYGAKNGSEFTEDKRKKRQRTSKMHTKF